MEKNSHFSKNLIYLRKKNRLTQSELSNKIQVDQTTIGRWEDGNREPTLGNIVNIAKFFKIKVNELLDKDLEIEDAILENLWNDYENTRIYTIKNYASDEIEESLLLKCFELNREEQKQVLEYVNFIINKRKQEEKQ